MDMNCSMYALGASAQSVLLFPFQIGKEYEVAVKPGPSFKVCHIHSL